MTERASQGGSPHRWWHPLVLWGPPLAGLVWVLLVEPGPETTPPCPSMRFLGLPCPACGTLRGVHAMGHGEWEHAFALQPLLPIALVGFGFYLVFRRRLSVWWSTCSRRTQITVQVSAGLAFVIWWAVRILLYQWGQAGPV